MSGRHHAAAVLVVISLVAISCSRSGEGRGAGTRSTPTTAAASGSGSPPSSAPTGDLDGGLLPAVELPIADHPRGGSVRVGVWAAPDSAAPTIGGAAVRALVLPQLFVALPQGRWASGLAEPGSDRTSEDERSASLRLRAGATWSDGSPINADDLRRTADKRFVAGVDGPAENGTITVRFTDRLPGWRRLWSGSDSIAAPAPGLWGGPFLVAAQTPGLETVLVRNPRWWGAGGPYLDEVRLVLVPDATTARLLLSAGELDVVAPLAATVRTEQFRRLPGVKVDRSEVGGIVVSIQANPERLDAAKRAALLAAVDRRAFVETLLEGEATVANGFAGSSDGAWADVVPGDSGALKGSAVDLIGFGEEPMTTILHRSMQKRARAAGGTLELRVAEADRVEGWLRDSSYEAALVVSADPLVPCWICRWPDVAGAAAADTGDPAAVAAVESALLRERLVLPLWRESTVTATRSGISGVVANGYALSAAWNAWEWWRSGA